MQVELPGLFAAEAQATKAVPAQEPDRADHAVGRDAVGVAVVERNDQVVRVQSGWVRLVLDARTAPDAAVKAIQ
jgi:hypothetical protein